jgi:transcriptional regulator GlxA family with amidase domain
MSLFASLVLEAAQRLQFSVPPGRKKSKRRTALLPRKVYKDGVQQWGRHVDEELIDRWRRRFERAASLLSGRLDDPPSLAELASAAAVSPFHFHRIWRALTRETVGQTVLRLRMEASQELLAVKDASLTETATAVGFGTPQSLSMCLPAPQSIYCNIINILR